MYKAVAKGVEGFFKDLLSANDVFRVYEVYVCNKRIFYSPQRIDFTERKMKFEYSLDSYDNNDYFLFCEVLEKGEVWEYTCKLLVKPRYSPDFDLLQVFKGSIRPTIPVVEVNRVSINPCPRLRVVYLRLLEAGAFELFPLRARSDTIGNLIVSLINSEFYALLEKLNRCEDYKDVATMLYRHLELAERIGLVKRVDEIKVALVPCWTEHQCFLRDSAIALLSFFGVEFDLLGRVKGLDVSRLLRLVIATTLAFWILRKIVKLVRRIEANAWISRFGG